MPLHAGDRLPDATFRTLTPRRREDAHDRRGVRWTQGGAVCRARGVLADVQPDAPARLRDASRCDQGWWRRRDRVRVCKRRVGARRLGREHGANGKVLMLSDGNLEFTRAVGMELDATIVGEGFRSQRYAAIVDDGVVTEIKVDEKPWLAEASSASSIAGCRCVRRPLRRLSRGGRVASACASWPSSPSSLSSSQVPSRRAADRCRRRDPTVARRPSRRRAPVVAEQDLVVGIDEECTGVGPQQRRHDVGLRQRGTFRRAYAECLPARQRPRLAQFLRGPASFGAQRRVLGECRRVLWQRDLDVPTSARPPTRWWRGSCRSSRTRRAAMTRCHGVRRHRSRRHT